MIGLIGKKIGMTQVWDEAGRMVAVTVLELGPCPVVQVKDEAKDGYAAVQLGFGPQKPQRLTKALRTRFERAGVPPCRKLTELGTPEGGAQVGDTLTVAMFEDVKYVDVTAVSKGRGTAGVVRRYGFVGGPHGHGSQSKNKPGSIGPRDGRVIKGKPMPGRMGGVRVTTQNLPVVQVRAEDNVLLVRGAVPGPNGGAVIVKKALKKA